MGTVHKKVKYKCTVFEKQIAIVKVTNQLLMHVINEKRLFSKN